MTSKHHFLIGTPDHSAPKTVVIAGAARGGTSMVAGTVREMGINLGERLGENHEDPQFLPLELDIIRARIQERNESLDTWGWKMPHSLGYLDEIEPDLRNPHIILVWRNSLATALSHVTRSGAGIDESLTYSTRRTLDMVEKLRLIKSPVLLVNYEQAAQHPEDFTETLAQFLGVDLDQQMRKNCLRFIDPETGYKQVSQTYYHVDKVTCEFDTPLQHVLVPKALELIEGSAHFLATGGHPRFIMRTGQKRPLPKEFVLRFENASSETSNIQFLFDFDWQFSQNMSFKSEVEPGIHCYKITTNGKLRRIGLIPNITDGKSDLINPQLLEA